VERLQSTQRCCSFSLWFVVFFLFWFWFSWILQYWEHISEVLLLPTIFLGCNYQEFLSLMGICRNYN
jgi:hypothetical protein